MIGSIFDMAAAPAANKPLGKVVKGRTVDVVPVNRWTGTSRSLINTSRSDYNVRSLFEHQTKLFDRDRINVVVCPYTALDELEGPEVFGDNMWEYTEHVRVYLYIHATKLCNNRYATELFKGEWVEFEFSATLNAEIILDGKTGQFCAVSFADTLPEEEYQVFLCKDNSAASTTAYINKHGQLEPTDYEGHEQWTGGVSIEMADGMCGLTKVQCIPRKRAIHENIEGFHLRACTFSKATGYRTLESSLYGILNILCAYGDFIGAEHETDSASAAINMFGMIDGMAAARDQYRDTRNDVTYQSFNDVVKEALKTLTSVKILAATDEEIEKSFSEAVYGTFEVDGEKYEVAKPRWLIKDEITFNSMLAVFANLNRTILFNQSQFDSNGEAVYNLLKGMSRDAYKRYDLLIENPFVFAQIMRTDKDGVRHIYVPEYSVRFNIPEQDEIEMMTGGINRAMSTYIINNKEYISHMAKVAFEISKVNFSQYTPIIDCYGDMVDYSDIADVITELVRHDHHFNCEGSVMKCGIAGSGAALVRYFRDQDSKNLETLLKVNEETQYTVFEIVFSARAKKKNSQSTFHASSGEVWKNADSIVCFDNRSTTVLGHAAGIALALTNRSRNDSGLECAGDTLKEIKAANVKFPEELHIKDIEVSAKNEITVKLNRKIRPRGFFLDRMAEYLGYARDTMFILNPDLVPNKIEGLDAFKLKLNVRDGRIVVNELNRAGPPPYGTSVLSHPNIGSNTRVCSGETMNTDLLSFLETLEVINYDSSYNYNLFGESVCPIAKFIRDCGNSRETAEAKATNVELLKAMFEDFGIVPDTLATDIYNAG